MVDPNDLKGMSEQEKIELLSMLAEADERHGVTGAFYLPLLRDPSPEVRKLALSAFWEWAAPEFVEPLVDLARHDPDLDVRARAISVLGMFVYNGAIAMELPESCFLRVRRFLMDVARDSSQPLLMRRMAIEALSFDPADDVAELIEWAYHHEDEDMNLSALFSMGRGQSDRWTDYIVVELHSSNRRRRLEAITAASEGFVSEATPRLRALAMSRDRETRLGAIWALAHTGGPGALEVLEFCAESKDEEVREAAEEAIMEYTTFQESDVDDLGFGDIEDM